MSIFISVLAIIIVATELHAETTTIMQVLKLVLAFRVQTGLT